MNSGETVLAVVKPLPAWLNYLVLVATLLLAAFAVFVWAVAFRKKPRPRKRRHRREHHEQRRPNPTLAETGGLPPAHEPENPPPQNPSP
jgi:hypothetical protein